MYPLIAQSQGIYLHHEIRIKLDFLDASLQVTAICFASTGMGAGSSSSYRLGTMENAPKGALPNNS
jgi:hypothetical protein